MDEQLKTRLDHLFEEIDRLEKESDLFHIAGSKSNFTREVEELRGLHETMIRDYHEYQKSGKADLEQFRNSLKRNSEVAEKKLNLVKKSYSERRK